MLVAPLEAAGARVDVMFTMPASCSDDQVDSVRGWLGPRVVTHHRIIAGEIGPHRDDGNHFQGASWKLGYRLLEKHMRSAGREYDFVMHTRHDIFIDASWATWPLSGFYHPQEKPTTAAAVLHEGRAPHVTWDSMLFLQEMRMCGRSCGVGFLHHWPLWDWPQDGSERARQNAEWLRVHGPGSEMDLAGKKPWPPTCSLCVRDHVVWTPRRHLQAVLSLVRDEHCCHGFVQDVEKAGVPRREMGFMMPALCEDLCFVPYGPVKDGECDRDPNKVKMREGYTFHSTLMCDDKDNYRPLRQGHKG